LAVEASGTKLDASLSISSTADYAKKVLLQLLAQTVRQVTPFERLTYLMTVLGVPFDEAPWIAFQVSRLVRGDRLIGRLSEEFKLAAEEPKPPEPYFASSPKNWEDFIRVKEQELIAAGFPEERLVDPDARGRVIDLGGRVIDRVDSVSWRTGNRLLQVLGRFVPRATMWAHSDVGQSRVPPDPRPNPWAGKARKPDSK
jgi:hypothetical protein